MMEIKIDLKFYGYQILGVLIIWLGMTFFFDDIKGAGIYIYYAVTSWLLFLIVLAGKKIFKDRQDKKDEKL